MRKAIEQFVDLDDEELQAWLKAREKRQKQLSVMADFCIKYYPVNRLVKNYFADYEQYCVDVGVEPVRKREISNYVYYLYRAYATQIYSKVDKAYGYGYKIG